MIELSVSMDWIEDPIDLRIEGYTSILCIGGSGCGKTQLSVSVALNRSKVFNKPHEKCIIFHRYDQSVFLDACMVDKSIILVNTKEDLENELVDCPSCLVIADDFLSSALYGEDNRFVTKFFLERSHHMRITFFFKANCFILNQVYLGGLTAVILFFSSLSTLRKLLISSVHLVRTQHLCSKHTRNVWHQHPTRTCSSAYIQIHWRI